MGGKILVVGGLNMDLVINVTRLTQIEETIIGGQFNTFPGGKDANQAVAAARMGTSVTMIGRIGRDGFGEELRKSAIKDGRGGLGDWGDHWDIYYWSFDEWVESAGSSIV